MKYFTFLILVSLHFHYSLFGNTVSNDLDRAKSFAEKTISQISNIKVESNKFSLHQIQGTKVCDLLNAVFNIELLEDQSIVIIRGSGMPLGMIYVDFIVVPDDYEYEAIFRIVIESNDGVINKADGNKIASYH